ncbi:MAG: hypothetical protein KDD58_12835 [Bdellovibrionales bacterium]|nr:hypothetical protein [Bdellovibrionales bacterium]
MKKSFCFLLLLTSFNLALAENSFNATIISFNKVKGKLLIKSKDLEQVNAGDILKYGSFCTLEVSKKTISRAILISDLCRKKDLPKVGSTVVFKHSPADKFSVKRTKVINNNKTVMRIVRPTPVKSISSNGFRIEISKPTLEQQVAITDKELGFQDNFIEGNTTALGASVGYTRVNIKDLGLSAKINFTHYRTNLQSIKGILNATYGFNEHIYAFAGGNGNKFTREFHELNFGAGYQAGIGLQLNENFGIELSKFQLNNEGTIRKEDSIKDVSYQIDGVELSLHATF